MQAVILAAGRGTRMKELTKDLPKPMLSVLGENLIEHKLKILPSQINEVVLVVGYLAHKIREHFGDNWNGRKIKYVEQKELLGTGQALFEARDLLHGKFMVLMGDDIYCKRDLEACAANGWAIMVENTKMPGVGARVVLDKNGHLESIIEKQNLEPGMIRNTGLYVLGKEFFNYPLVSIGAGEYGLPQTLVEAAKDFPVKVIEATDWHQITTADDIDRVGELLKNGKGAK